MIRKCDKCNRQLPYDCADSVYCCTQGIGCSDYALPSKTYKDKDGDAGIEMQWKFDDFGLIWRKLKYKNGKISWQPDTFLTQIFIYKNEQ